MKNNRRNHYRILHVQPEAPLEVIKASYRALMHTLRLHPDLGGDHEQAVRLNEAYAVLRDPAKRDAYDRTLQSAKLRARRPPASAPASSAGSATKATQSAPASAATHSAWREKRICPFCCTSLPSIVRTGTRCGRCDSPLGLPPRMACGSEMFGRRGSTRVSRSLAAFIYPGWRKAAVQVRLRDLSLSGVSFHTLEPVQVNQVIRILDPAFEAVAMVVKCWPQNKIYTVHAQLMTMLPVAVSNGVFVRESV